MKRYIVTSFDGWYWNWWIINEDELADYADGSFDDDKYQFYKLGKKLTEGAKKASFS